MASPGRDIQFLHCPDSLMPAATVLSMISRASLDGTLQPQAPSVSLPPLGKVGGGGGAEERQLLGWPLKLLLSPWA